MIFITTARTLQTIINELQADIISRNPAIADWSPVSVNLTLAQAYSKLIYDLEQDIISTANSLWVNTATDSDLDKLVVDRLPAGRQPGTEASGSVTFSRTTSAPVDIAIPKGTIISQPNPSGVPVYFITTEDVTLVAGTLSIASDAIAMMAGTNGNAPAFTIIGLINVPSGITSVTNPLAFTNGTDAESDDALRKRYIYSVNIPGRATSSMIVQHLIDLQSVTEAMVFTELPGVVEIVVDSNLGVTNYDTTIAPAIVDNLAAGVIARGLVGATIVSGTITPNINTGAGGYVFAIVNSVPTSAETMTISYIDQNGLTKTSAVLTIPFGSAIGTSYPFVFQNSTDRATVITNVTYTGSGNYTLVIGLGKELGYPYLFNLPVSVPVTMTVSIKHGPNPDGNLRNEIIASLTAAITAYTIGKAVEFADLVLYIYTDYTYGTVFSGIDDITSIAINANGQTITEFGQTIILSEQQRARVGLITVNVT